MVKPRLAVPAVLVIVQVITSEMVGVIEKDAPVPASDVGLLELRRHLSRLAERGLHLRSVARKISAIRAFFRWLADGFPTPCPATRRLLRSSPP